MDIEDPDLRNRGKVIYGDKPEVLNIAFFSNTIEDVFRCTYNRWVDNKGVSRLLCEGNGVEAVERGQKRSCPCPWQRMPEEDSPQISASRTFEDRVFSPCDQERK